jgi:hypothetical protein
VSRWVCQRWIKEFSKVTQNDSYEKKPPVVTFMILGLVRDEIRLFDVIGGGAAVEAHRLTGLLPRGLEE